jgi:hypothetical protein
MFAVTEAEAAAIRTAFDQGGEFAAALELCRLFPGVTDNAETRECARTIAAWKRLPVPAQRVRRVAKSPRPPPGHLPMVLLPASLEQNFAKDRRG